MPKTDRTDFNDLHNEKGLKVVKAQLEAAVERFKAGEPLIAVQESTDFELEIPPPPPVEAYNDDDEVRQQIVRVENRLLPKAELSNRLDLKAALARFAFVTPAGTVWDTLHNRQMKKAVFKDLVGIEICNAWLASDQRKGTSDQDVNRILRAQIEQHRKSRLEEPWQDNFLVTESGIIKADIANAKLVLDNDKRWLGVLGYCDFSYRIVKRRAPPFNDGEPGEWTDTDTDRLRIWLSEQYTFTPKSADAHGAVVVAAESNRFHPVREYLIGLQWDKVPRVRSWLHTYLGSDESRYSSLVGTMWLVSAVARVMQPPVKVDSVIIFEGLQGLGKSTALSVLAGDWFTDTPVILGDKDGFQQMQGVWVIELAELDSFNKAESTRAKQFFGSKVDRYRPSYGRMVQTFARQCIFAGTTNQESYLKDATGNRRYWPVRCSKVEAELLLQDRDQLWAEAYQLYMLGEKWWPQDCDLHLFEQQQEDRFESDVWEELIKAWLRSISKDRVLISEIMEEALGMQAAQMKPPEQKRVGQIMAHLSWRKMRARTQGGREAGYVRPDNWKIGVDGEVETVDDIENF